MDKYQKLFLRKQHLEARHGLMPDAVERYNRSLLEQIRTVDWSTFACLHTFLPISAQNEPDTFRVIAWLRSQYPNIKIVVPKVAFGGSSLLAHHVLEENTTLWENKWGIPEPEGSLAVPPKDIDAVLIPLLAFDLTGHRVGYGRGFYDRFLSVCRPDVMKVGLSFFDPVPRITDVLETDVPLDCCITPKQVYWFEEG